MLGGMESVTSLDLSGNYIKRGWERLQPLTRLRDLHVAMDNRNVPEALNVLTNLKILSLY